MLLKRRERETNAIGCIWARPFLFMRPEGISSLGNKSQFLNSLAEGATIVVMLGE